MHQPEKNKAIISQERLNEANQNIPKDVLLKYEICSGQLSTEDKAVYNYICGFLPFADLVDDATPDIVLESVQHGIYLYNKYAYVQKLSADIFLEYVLFPRINNERLSLCRKALYREFSSALSEADLENFSFEAAAIAVNYKCSAEVSYASTDGRTCSVLGILRAAQGRCGEESTFVVQAMRSLGIPARQIYTPKWAHCDDNHAWVEIYAGTSWKYLGACEPEETLNKGWFTQSSRRAILVHSKRFTPPQLCDDIICENGAVYQLNHIQNYADTKKLEIIVTSKAGPVSEAKINIKLLNYAEFAKIACLVTDINGCASLVCGKGDLLLSVYHDNLFVEKTITSKQTKCVFDLSTLSANEAFNEYEFCAPPATPSTLEYTENSSAHNKKVAAAIIARTDKIKTFYEKSEAAEALSKSAKPEKLIEVLKNSRGNFSEILSFLNKTQKYSSQNDFTAKEIFHLKERLLFTLSEKDLYEVEADFLENHFSCALQHLHTFSEDIFDKYIMCPRIHKEQLSLWASEISMLFDQQCKDKFIENPQMLWSYISKNISQDKASDFDELITSPAACVKSKKGGILSRKILFVAACRSFGIAAKLRKEDLAPMFYANGEFLPASDKDLVDSSLQLINKDSKSAWIYNANFSLSFFNDGEWRVLNLSGYSWQRENLRIKLKHGIYRLVCTNRLPSGKQLANSTVFELCSNTAKKVFLQNQEAKSEDMFQNFPLQKLEFATSQKPIKHPGIFIWLRPSEEPSQHIINELLEAHENFHTVDKHISLILVGETKNHNSDNALISSLEQKLPNITILKDTTKNHSLIARELFLEPELLPLVLLTNKQGNAAYSNTGYNVNTAEMLLKLWHHQSE